MKHKSGKFKKKSDFIKSRDTVIVRSCENYLIYKDKNCK